MGKEIYTVYLYEQLHATGGPEADLVRFGTSWVSDRLRALDIVSMHIGGLTSQQRVIAGDLLEGRRDRLYLSKLDAIGNYRAGNIETVHEAE